MRRRHYNFRFHLGILGALTAVPFILAGAVMAALYVNSERQSTERDLVTAAKDLSSGIDREIVGGLTTLKTLALAQTLAQNDLAAFYQQAARVAGIVPGSIVGLRRPDGQQLINSALAWGTPLPKTIDPVLIEADQAAIKSMQSVVSNLYTSVSTGRHFVMLDLPVIFEGTPHLLNMAMPPESILRLVQQSSVVREGWLVVVIDANHHVIARSRDHANFVGRRASDDFIKKLTSSEGVFESTTLDAERVIDGYVRSPLTGWTVVTAAPVSEVDQSVRQAAIAVFVAGGLGLICSLLLAILYSRYITPPIWRLRNEALALSRRQPVAAFNTGITELDAVSDTLASASATLIRDEEAKNQMIKELNHRVKNSLATVISIARQTSAKTDNFNDFFEDFSGRLVALSQSHDALSEGEWMEAGIHDLMQRICVSVAGPERIALDGPPVLLRPRAVLTMGMVLHELCTNSLKYGALAQPDGNVSVEWAVQPHAADGPVFSFTWIERGGPPVTPPEQRSFGTRFIQESLRHELWGTAEFDFRPEGLVFRCRFPLRPPAANKPAPEATETPQA
jgi:two-component sensor histidine kinase